MKKEGYIPVSRKLFEHPFWIEKREFSYAEAWIDLLRLARFESDAAQMLVSGKLISVKRGEYPVSLRYLSEAWKWSKNRVDRFLKLLISEGMITKRTAKGTKQTIITICKYDDYNVLGADRGTKKGQRKDKERTKMGQRRDKKRTKLIREIRERKKIITLYPFSANLILFRRNLEKPFPFGWITRKSEKRNTGLHAL